MILLDHCMLGNKRGQKNVRMWNDIDIDNVSILKGGPANLSVFLKVCLIFESVTKCKKEGQF